MRVQDTLARVLHSGNACMNECPSVPHDTEQEEEEMTGDRGGTERGESSGSFFFNSSGDEAGPFGPYVDPSRELSDLTWSSSKRFSRSGPLARLFFVPKNG